MILIHLGVFRNTSQFDDSASGSYLWSVAHGGAVRSIGLDDSGNVFIGGDRSSTDGQTTKKYSSSGVLLNDVNHGDTVYGLAIGPGGTVHTCGARYSSKTTKKYTNTLGLTWSVNHGNTVYSIAVDTSGNVYTGGADSSSLTTRKYNSAGTLQWSVNHGATVFAIAADASGNVYTGGQIAGDEFTTRKYNSAGVLQWSVNHGATVLSIAVDASGNVYTGGNETSDSLTTRKYNSAGTLQWSVNHKGDVTGIKVDAGGNVYTTGAYILSDAVTTRKYNSSGALQWSFNAGNVTYCIALGIPAAVEFSAPALSIPIMAALPWQGLTLRPPGMSIPILPGMPTSLADISPPDLSEISGPYRQIYRLYLSTENGLVECPLSSIQCRRRIGASTWLEAEIPCYTQLMMSLCSDNIGREIIIYAGIDGGSGEMMGEFLRAMLTDASPTWAPFGGIITLTGRVQTPAYTRQTRAAIGVQSISLDGDRHACRCAVDPLLRPNDAFFDGVDSWVCGSILYRIDAHGAWMDVQEVAA